MTGPGWTSRDVTAALERRCYQRLPQPERAAGNALWYGSPTSTTEAKQYLLLETKYGGTAWGVRVGFSSPAAKLILEAANPRINAGLVGGVTVRQHEYCLTLFDAGRFLNWPLLAIPHPNDTDQGPRQFEDFADKFLGPVCETVTTADAVLERLLRTEVPFDWGASNPVWRAAEVIATATVCRTDLRILHQQLSSYQGHLYSALRSGTKWASALDTLFQLIPTVV